MTAPERRKTDAVDAAARLLRYGDRSRAELEQRLAKRGLDGKAAAEALDALERVGVLDDARTAGLRAAKLAERGYGDAWIRAELNRRGLPIDEALAGLPPERERAAGLVRAKGVGPAWLARRGFDLEAIEAFAGDG